MILISKFHNEAQPILFLNLEGTLIKTMEARNAAQSAWILEHSRDPQEDEKTLPFYMSHDSVVLIRNLCARQNAKLVVHSNWTTRYKPEVAFNEMLRHGFKDSDFHHDWCLSVNLLRLCITDPGEINKYRSWYRVQEDSDGRQWRIPAWLMLHPEIDNFAIFDDRAINAWEKNDGKQGVPFGCTVMGSGMTGPFHARWVPVQGANAITQKEIDIAAGILATADADCVWHL